MKKKTGLIDTWTDAQNENHCGPCSLAYCLALLGIPSNQREVVKASGLTPQYVTGNGMEPEALSRAALHFGASLEENTVVDRLKGAEFIHQLKTHLLTGNPALFLKDDFGHWVSVYGWVPEVNRFIVADPLEDEPFLAPWTEKDVLSAGWNVDEDDEEESQYCALFLKRHDGKPAVIKMTSEWIRLARRHEDSREVLVMFNDLVEVAESATPSIVNIEIEPTTVNSLRAFLMTNKNAVVSSITHWCKEAVVSPEQLADFYDDLVTIADAVSQLIPRQAHLSVAVQIASLASIYWWWGEEYFD